MTRMPRRRIAGIVSVLALAVITVAPPASAELPSGKPAPAFSVKAANGLTLSLADYKGKTVVIEWTNPECPYVKKHYDSGNMQKLHKEATGQGVVWLTVTSAVPGKQGYVSDLEAQAWIDTQKAAPTAVLLDRDGRMADAYGVKLALHMFVIDPEGRVAYQGAVDDKPTSKVADVVGATNYVRLAMSAIASGSAPKPAITRPYGCLAR